MTALIVAAAIVAAIVLGNVVFMAYLVARFGRETTQRNTPTT